MDNWLRKISLRAISVGIKLLRNLHLFLTKVVVISCIYAQAF